MTPFGPIGALADGLGLTWIVWWIETLLDILCDVHYEVLYEAEYLFVPTSPNVPAIGGGYSGVGNTSDPAPGLLVQLGPGLSLNKI